jgi:MinD-like ATPase involved in chromosome partitioning or flagellar assembly
MYVTTFYSFKGGVGRTLALVNVGVQLARSGRKVLLVDFDIEAPGIHTFEKLRPPEPHCGVVEYVTDFIATRSAPDVREYMYGVDGLGEEGGRVWVMPAGRGGEEYRQRLASINWQGLYNELDGFLFFEDLKAQWAEAISPDYVLIDSRTGHTDVGGICTRQLPDAVVALFFPNEQNMEGLREVVADINAESGRSRVRRGPVRLHLVMSNVPDLDDEDGILRRRVQECRKTLKCDSPLMIHSYPSLALLNQAIFTVERPKSRLAREYKRLKDQIVDYNDEDPEGVVRFLKRIGSPFNTVLPRGVKVFEEKLQSIQRNHGKNGEVAFRLGLIRKNQARLDEAVSLLDRAVDAPSFAAVAYLERATCRLMQGKPQEAIRDVTESLHSSGLKVQEVCRAIDLLGKLCPATLWTVPQSSSFLQLDVDDKLLVARALSKCEAGLSAAVGIYSAVVCDLPSHPAPHFAEIRNYLTVALIGAGRFGEAMSVIAQSAPRLHGLEEVADAFNFAIAQWGETKVPPRDMFRVVVELDHKEPALRPERSPNYDQCLALALFVAGDTEAAQARLSLAEKAASELEHDEFSCWRYKDVNREDFLADCRAIASLLQGGQVEPAVFSAGSGESSRKASLPPPSSQEPR